uniref:DUF1618 domain-containing protein n=2 Tax=Oryza TaxID=4527 RepID=A0A0D3GV96_9ORYZ
MSSKRKRQDRDEYDRCGGVKTAPAPEKRRKHLYLMLDDRDNAYRMHKIDVDALADSEEDDMLLLPEPALLQFGTDRHSGMCFFALGSSIFATRPPHTPALVYDTDTGGLTVGPPLPNKLCGGPNITMAMADNKTMYALYDYDTNYLNPHPMEAMSWEAVPCTERHLPRVKEWTWKSVPSQPPYGRLDEIVSYAVHPDQCTFFVSVKEAFCSRSDGGNKGTFSFDTKHCEWRWHGDWMLPFERQGYYDAELDAWVGLRLTDGRVCACRVASRSSSAPPEWKLLQEKLFCKDPQERQLMALSGIRPSLAYMQGSGRFCLLECVLREGVDWKHAFGDDAHGCLLRLTIFGLKYDHQGELHTSIHRTNASYIVSKHNSSFSPVAFWM